jgi:glycosyltransferase involved in cell wall biosynthesis
MVDIASGRTAAGSAGIPACASGTSPLVSVVIPAYNNGELVREAVASVLAQTYSPVEVIVVDDGSEDGALDKLATFSDRARLVRQEHKGPAVARNVGIRASRGEVVAFLDSDDLWMPEKLAKSLVPLLSGAGEVVYTDVRVRDLVTGAEQYSPCYRIEGSIAQDLFVECRGVSLSTLITWRRCLDAINLFDEAFFRAQDWDLFLRLAERYTWSFVPEVLTIRRAHARSLGVARRDLYREYNLKVIETALKRRPDLYAPLRAKALGLAYFRFGMLNYEGFDMALARRDLWTSFHTKPGLTSMNYILRTLLPVGLVARLRRRKLARQEAQARHG